MLFRSLRKQRQAGSDPADNRDPAFRPPARRRWNGERPRLEFFLLQTPFPFQRIDMVLNRCRINPEVPADLSNRRREAVARHIIINEVQNGLLAFGKHEILIPEQVFGSQGPNL